MRTIIIMFFCALAGMVSAQTTTKDTTFVQRGSGINRYVTNRVTRADGNVRVYTSGVLDTTTAQQYVAAQLDGKMNSMVLAAQESFGIDALVKPLLLGETTSKDTLGTFLSPLSAMEEKYKTGWVFSDWTFQGTGSTVIAEDGTTGALEITISATDYRCIVGSDWIIIKEYPSAGAYTALWRIKPGTNTFRNFARDVTLSR
jgi:hypothetical protein